MLHSPDLSSVFSALADPTRRAILARLAQGEAPVKELAAPFQLSAPAITKHLHVLERAGLISRARVGQQRPCRLEPQALAPAADWIAQHRLLWEARLDRLDAFLHSVQAHGASGGGAPAFTKRAGPTAAPAAPAAPAVTAAPNAPATLAAARAAQPAAGRSKRRPTPRPTGTKP